MTSRRRALRFGAVVLLFGSALVARAQSPGVNDHLKCYRVKDPLSLSGVVDLNGPQYGLEPGCKIAKPFLFCVPVQKTVQSAVNTATKPPTPITPLPVSGPDPGDRICYRIKCQPGPAISQLVTDQFGTRGVSGIGKGFHFQAYMLCTPAYKGTFVPPTTTTTVTCPVPTTTTTTTSTTSTTTPSGCVPFAAGGCAGTCPNPADVCQMNSSGVCFCGCGVNTSGICGGTCPNTGDTCMQPLGQPCGCYPQHCGPQHLPTCTAGQCPPGFTCRVDTTGTNCVCL